jgi:hypothetical protein
MSYTPIKTVNGQVIEGTGNVNVAGNYAQIVQSATITGLAEASIIATGVGAGVGSLSIPANAFQVGDSFHAKIGGVIDGSNNNDELIVRVKAGTTVLATTGVIILDQTNTNGWECELDFTIVSIGATGTIYTNGNFAYTKNVDKKVQGNVFQDVQSINTIIANTLDITMELNNTNTNIYSANFVLYRTF